MPQRQRRDYCSNPHVTAQWIIGFCAPKNPASSWSCQGPEFQTFVIFRPAIFILVRTKRDVPMAQLTPPKRMAYLNWPWLSMSIWPPIGDPVKAANAESEKAVPVRTPISCMGEIWAARTGVRPIPAPDPIPKSAANNIIGALPVAGSHRARIRIVVKALITIMVLKRPALSAIALGTVRPIMLVKFSLSHPRTW